MGDDCCSEWNTVPAGVPQRTNVGPWLFLVIMNELDLLGDVNLWKYVEESKCKELRIGFSITKNDFDPIIINNREIEVAPQVKLLGLTISNDLKWNSHVKNICKNASTRLYFLRQLKRANVPSNDLLLFYVTCTRPVIDYAWEVFHDSLPAYLSDDLERLQKRACKIILPDYRYNEAMV